MRRPAPLPGSSAVALAGLVVLVAILAFAALAGCAGLPSPLAGAGPLAAAPEGRFLSLASGVVYLPAGFDPDRNGAWPATVVLHGYGELSRSLAARAFWKLLADRYGIVLAFPETGRMGWREARASPDTALVLGWLKTLRRQSWLKPGGLQLAGWSAGAIMAQGFTILNRSQADGKPLADSFGIISGGFGTVLQAELKGDPAMRRAVRVPMTMVWGDQEPPSQGPIAADYLRSIGWDVELVVHPGGHVLAAEYADAFLVKNRR
jgi:predicted esterase